RRRAIAGAVVAAVGLVVLSLAVFGGLDSLGAFHSQSGLWTNRSILGQLGRIFGLAKSTADLTTPAVVALGVVVTGLVAWTWRTRDAVTAAAWVGAALVLALTWEFPWYVAWLLPFSALAPGYRARLVAVAFSGMLLV